MAAAAAGGLSKNNKSPPPHSGWRLDKYGAFVGTIKKLNRIIRLKTQTIYLQTLPLFPTLFYFICLQYFFSKCRL